MTVVRRRLPAQVAVLFLAAMVVAACGDRPPTPSPSPTVPPTPTPAPLATERAFAPGAWPAAGSACATAGYDGLLGRIEATGPRTVRFTLCEPDGAFLARLAHPSLGVIDAVEAQRVATDPSAARDVAGAGSFRVAAWPADDNVRLERVPGADAPAGAVPTIVLRWSVSATGRVVALRGADVDGIDAPAESDLDTMATLPELELLPRPGLATAYLGFGAGRQLTKTGVRRAFGQGLDRVALAGAGFAAGSVAADYLAPCPVAGGCAGTPWYEFNGPTGSAALDDAGFDRKVAVPLHVPEGPVPGISDPATLAAAIRDQLGENLGVKVRLVTEPAEAIDAAVADRSIDGLYLAGIASPLADATGYLGPLFAPGEGSLTAARGRTVRQALDDSAAVTEPDARAAALGEANDALRAAVPLVPLVHEGATTAWRSDVEGLAVSPIGADPLGTFVPGDRGQVVVMGAAEPDGAWCGVTLSLDALRLCALVTPGLYAFDGATLQPVPALATACTPSDGARTWTCRLGAGREFSGGAKVDAGDMLETFRVLGDPASPLRASLPATAFAAWDGLFGGPLPAPRPDSESAALLEQVALHEDGLVDQRPDESTGLTVLVEALGELPAAGRDAGRILGRDGVADLRGAGEHVGQRRVVGRSGRRSLGVARDPGHLALEPPDERGEAVGGPPHRLQVLVGRRGAEVGAGGLDLRVGGGEVDDRLDHAARPRRRAGRQVPAAARGGRRRRRADGRAARRHDQGDDEHDEREGSPGR